MNGLPDLCKPEESALISRKERKVRKVYNEA